MGGCFWAVFFVWFRVARYWMERWCVCEEDGDSTYEASDDERNTEPGSVLDESPGMKSC